LLDSLLQEMLKLLCLSLCLAMAVGLPRRDRRHQELREHQRMMAPKRNMIEPEGPRRFKEHRSGPRRQLAPQERFRRQPEPNRKLIPVNGPGPKRQNRPQKRPEQQRFDQPRPLRPVQQPQPVERIQPQPVERIDRSKVEKEQMVERPIRRQVEIEQQPIRRQVEIEQQPIRRQGEIEQQPIRRQGEIEQQVFKDRSWNNVENEVEDSLEGESYQPVYLGGPAIAKDRSSSYGAPPTYADPPEQAKLEAAVSAGAANYNAETYDDPKRLSFQIHGQGGPNSYRFGYDTGVGYNRQFRYEERDANGVLHGRYGYYDQEGKLQIVNYKADPQTGFHADGDHVPKPQY